MFGSFVPPHCRWVDLFYCLGLKVVVHVVEWEWIFEMDVVEFVVVVEVDDINRIELGMEETEETIEDNMDFSHEALSNLATKIGFVGGVAKVSKERVCSSYLEIVFHNLEIVI